MSLISDIDVEKRDQFLKHAAYADAMALKTHDAKDRETWRYIADAYREMAEHITRKLKL